MRGTILFVALFIVFAFIVCPSRAQSSGQKPKDITLFSVDKNPFSAAEFIYLYRKNHQEKPGEYTKEKIDEYLNLFINFKLKVQEAKRRGLDTTQTFKKEYNTYREELRKPYLPDAKLIDSLVRLTYERLKEEVRAAHLLINVAPEAGPEDTLKAYQKVMDFRNRILQGETFEAVAETYSQDPSVKHNKGDLGYFTAMQMVFPFEQAAYNTPVGGLSMPVRTRFGYHLIKVTDRRPSRGEVEVSHIMLRTGDAKAKNTIFEIYDQLQKGVPWDELCHTYSEDFSTKDNGGKLRPFGVGAMSAVPEFERIAFNLENTGDYSDPFQTRFGWHIIRLEKKIPVPPYDELLPSLRNKVSHDERVQISKQTLQTKMKEEFGFKEISAVKSKVLSLADTTLKKTKWNPSPDIVDPDLILFTIRDKKFSVKDFFAFARQHQTSNVPGSEKQLTQVYDQYVENVLGLLQEEKIKKQNPDYNWLLKEYYEGILLFEIMEKEVWNKASEDSTGQQNYFKNHASAYKAGERMKGQIFSSSSKNTLEQLKRLIEAKDSVKIIDFVEAERIRRESGAFEKTERPALAKITWTPGTFLTENNGLHYLVWIKEILPPGFKTFDEARPAVIADYQTYLEKRWVDELKKRHPVKIVKKGKQHVMQQLVKT